MRDRLLEQLSCYLPFNEQEEKDRAVMLDLLKKEPNIFLRSSLTAHVTASAWVVNRERTKTVFARHNLYNTWAWLGGHADGEEDLLSVALREVTEESGLRNLHPVSDELFSLELLPVSGHEKRGSYVPSHLHLNFTYLLEADEAEPLCPKEDENSAVAWFRFEDALAASDEEWFKERVYRKLIEKTKSAGEAAR